MTPSRTTGWSNGDQSFLPQSRVSPSWHHRNHLHLCALGSKSTFVLLGLILALTLPGLAQAHVPFKDGPGTARDMQRSLNRAPLWDATSCRYRAPHIICTGHLKTTRRTDVWYVYRMTVHKTKARKGYAVTCLTALGFCRREALTFAS